MFLPDRIAWQKFATLIKGEGEGWEVNLNRMPPLTRAKSNPFCVLCYHSAAYDRRLKSLPKTVLFWIGK
jgi:hypothetical protein